MTPKPIPEEIEKAAEDLISKIDEEFTLEELLDSENTNEYFLIKSCALGMLSDAAREYWEAQALGAYELALGSSMAKAATEFERGVRLGFEKAKQGTWGDDTFGGPLEWSEDYESVEDLLAEIARGGEDKNG